MSKLFFFLVFVCFSSPLTFAADLLTCFPADKEFTFVERIDISYQRNKFEVDYIDAFGFRKTVKGASLTPDRSHSLILKKSADKTMSLTFSIQSKTASISYTSINPAMSEVEIFICD